MPFFLFIFVFLSGESYAVFPGDCPFEKMVRHAREDRASWSTDKSIPDFKPDDWDPMVRLGFARDSAPSEEEIKSHYRKGARFYHPDKNPGDEEAARCYKRIQEAYDTLMDGGLRYFDGWRLTP